MTTRLADLVRRSLAAARGHPGRHIPTPWPQIGQFTEDGTVALSQIGLNFACRSCHAEEGEASEMTDDELIDAAFGYHDRPAPQIYNQVSEFGPDTNRSETKLRPWHVIIGVSERTEN